MRKSSFFTFCCAFIPGAGEMYLGMMKKGIAIMLGFFGIISIASFLNLEFLLFLLPIIWFYSFFETLNVKWMTEEQRKEIDDAFKLELLFGSMSSKKWLKTLNGKSSLFAGSGLIVIGIYLLFSNLIRPIIDTIFDAYGIDPWLFHYIIRSIPTLIISIAIIVLGIHLVRGKKTPSSEEDFVEFKGEHHE
ncbi:hypothetical protein [Marasmitruncus massiliensis]|uniref:hypothetical protein n=1 Tax=Marasmitruncus massiliensis TaxID=1944642 RepID=UPI000C7971D3|nr:hypothetical protein [Marasmitruncus massiliensis]